MAQFIRKTRLERKAEDQITKRTIILGMVTVLFLVFLVIFGIPALVRLAVFLGDVKNKNQQNVDEVVLPPMPPRLFVPYDATNSAQIVISGTAEAKTSVELSKDDSLITKVEVLDSGEFLFEDVLLDKGDNRFNAVVISEKGVRSTISSDLNISFDDEVPELTISSPEGGQATVETSEYEIVGKSEKGVSVTINGRIAMVDNNGEFKLRVELNQGNNDFEVISTDTAGNQTKTKVSIKYDI